MRNKPMTRSIAVKFEGCCRVLINEEGEALSQRRAMESGVLPDIAFLRKDGWVLGAPAHLESAAYGLWPDEWVGFCTVSEAEYKPMSLYNG